MPDGRAGRGFLRALSGKAPKLDRHAKPSPSESMTRPPRVRRAAARSAQLAVLTVLAAAAALLFAPAAGAQTGGGQGTGGIAVTTDVTYRQVDGVTLRLDAYVPPSGGRHPAIVLVHGGGYSSGDKHLMRQTGLFFAQSGYAAFAIDYRLAPQFVYPAQVDDAKAAVEFVRQHADEFRVIPERIGMLGTSAGATVAYTVGAEGTGDSSWHVAAVAGWSGPVAFSEHYDPSQGSGVLSQYVFGTSTPPGGADDLARIQAADPATKVTPASAPTFVANSTNELVPLTLAQAYVQILQDNGVPHDSLEVPGSRHGTMIGFAARYPTLRFFDQYVRDAAPVSPSPSAPPTTAAPTPTPSQIAVAPAGGSGNWLPLGIVAAVSVILLVFMVLLPAIRKRRRSRWLA
jgi:acetyl esterase